MTRPQLVLADEPTANLDSVTGQHILDLMKELNRTEKTTFIFSTHDQRVMAHANAIVRLADGKLLGAGRAGAAAPAQPREGARMRAWLDTLRRRRADRLPQPVRQPAQDVIVGGIIFFGALLVVVGNSLLDSVDAAMSRSIIGSVAGHIQVYTPSRRTSSR